MQAAFALPILALKSVYVLLVNDAAHLGEGLDFFQGSSIQHDWILTCGFYLEDLGVISVNNEANLR